MEDDRYPGCADAVDEEVRFRGGIEDNPDPELLRHPQRRFDVGGPVGGHQKRPLPRDDPREGFQTQIGRRAFLGIGVGLLPAVFHPLGQFGSQHGNRLRPRARGLLLPLGAPGVPERHGDHRGRLEHARSRCRLHHHRLAGDECPGRMAGVEGGDAEATDPFNEPLARVVGVERPQFRLDRLRGVELVLVLILVEIPRQADDTVGIDEPGGDHRGLENSGVGGDGHRGRRPDGDNPAIGDHHDAVGDRVAGHGVDDTAADGEGLTGSCGGAGGECDQRHG